MTERQDQIRNGLDPGSLYAEWWSADLPPKFPFFDLCIWLAATSAVIALIWLVIAGIWSAIAHCVLGWA